MSHETRADLDNEPVILPYELCHIGRLIVKV